MRELLLYFTIILLMIGATVRAADDTTLMIQTYDTPPKLLEQPEYSCPKQAQRMGIKGFVDLRVSIDTTGAVTSAKVIKCNRPMFGFEESALKIVRSSTFQPATKNGVAVESYLEYRISFSPGKMIQEPVKSKPSDSMTEHQSKNDSGFNLGHTDNIADANRFVPVDEMPQQIYEEIPQYPLKAFEAQATGYVIVQVYINSQGTVTKGRAAKCSNPGYEFEDAALKAAIKCKYKPAIQEGQPVGLWISYRVNFTMSN